MESCKIDVKNLDEHMQEASTPHDLGTYFAIERLRKSNRRIKLGLFAAGGSIVAISILLVCLAMIQRPAMLVGANPPSTQEITTTYDGSKALNKFDKRFPFAWALAAFQVIDTAYQIYNTYVSCKTLADAPSALNGVDCVGGALATVFSFAGAAYSISTLSGASSINDAAQSAWQSIQRCVTQSATACQPQAVQQLSTAVTTGGSSSRKRDSSFSMDLDKPLNMSEPIHTILALHQVAHGRGLNYTFQGLVHRSHSKFGHMVPKGRDEWPFFKLRNPLGMEMHHTRFPQEDGTGFHVFGPPPENSKRDLRGDTNEEYFTDGGIGMQECHYDVGPDDFNNGDFNYMLGEVQCATGGWDLNTLNKMQFGLVDSNGQTFGSGTTYPFTNPTMIPPDNSSPQTDCITTWTGTECPMDPSSGVGGPQPAY